MKIKVKNKISKITPNPLTSGWQVRRPALVHAQLVRDGQLVPGRGAARAVRAAAAAALR